MNRNKLHLSDLLAGIIHTTIFIGVICWLMSCSTVKNAKTSDYRIIKRSTDDRGLISVIYSTKHNERFALDYLTKREYDSLFNKSLPRYSITCTNDTIFYNNK